MLTIPKVAIGAFGFLALASWAAPIRETKLNGRLSKPWPSPSRETTMPHWRTLKSAISTSKSQPAKYATVAIRRSQPPLDEGDGWLYWSGLATLFDLAADLSERLDRLLILPRS